ncbi:MAG: hypothetical protein HY298_24330 [Verrucomicrobia bacterium]|nr:hypothetical protein [Verrucomicrobiota bacterium]
MRTNENRTTPASSVRRDFFILLLGLIAVLVVLFHKSFQSGQVIFSNDGPLGALVSQSDVTLNNLDCVWQPLNWLGTAQPSVPPSLVTLILLLTGPILYSKIIVPICLLVLGLCAWFYFRQMRFNATVCVIGGLAAALNMNYFTSACWGQISRPLTLGAAFLALAALQDNSSKYRWVKALLAGMAVGFSIMDSFDIGAIFSVFIAAFALFQALFGEGSLAKRWTQGILRIVLVAIFAALISAQTLSSLVGTQIKGVAGTKQDEQTKAERWDWATQWSLPKIETLQYLVPGLFGYRMDTPGGGNYWGSMGQDPEWTRYLDSGRQGQPPTGRMLRFTGGSTYGGLVVLVLALWGVLQSFRKSSSPFSVSERKYIWFWSGMAALSLLLAFGRYAPFYKLFYALPYASTIRNPAKFLHIFDWALLVVFGYGLQGFSRVYLEKARAVVKGVQPQNWWAKVKAADPKWIFGSIITLLASVLGWLVYASSRTNLESYLQTVGFEPTGAAEMARFSVNQVGWFVLFLTLTLGLVTWIMSGLFVGARAKWAGILLGLLLTVDLARANAPWIFYWNADEKYIQAGNNAVIDFLKQRPYDHRVALLPFQSPPQLSAMQQVYQIEWLQHLFQYYKIQSLDIVQMSRTPEDLAAFEGAVRAQGTPLTRRWELTNTRYLLGAAGFLDPLNQQIDPAQKRFKIHTLFNFYQTAQGGPILVQTNATGPYALIEFTGALPRAKLYANWQVSTNDEATLKQLASPTFDPSQTVLVADKLLAINSPVATNQNAGTVGFVSYSPKHIVLRARAEVPSVLLLNDHFDPNWRVVVDSQPATLLRCNYLMRGVQLAPGEHLVEFRFSSGEGSLYLTLAAILAGFALLAFVMLSHKRAAA